MAITARAVVRQVRALAEEDLWDNMVETYVVPRANEKVKQEYFKRMKTCRKGRKPDIVEIGDKAEYMRCVEATLGKEYLNEFRKLVSRDMAGEFMADTLSSLLGLKITAKEIIPTYISRRGHQSYRATDACKAALAKKGIRLLEAFKVTTNEDRVEGAPRPDGSPGGFNADGDDRDHASTLSGPMINNIGRQDEYMHVEGRKGAIDDDRRLTPALETGDNNKAEVKYSPNTVNKFHVKPELKEEEVFKEDGAEDMQMEGDACYENVEPTPLREMLCLPPDGEVPSTTAFEEQILYEALEAALLAKKEEGVCDESKPFVPTHHYSGDKHNDAPRRIIVAGMASDEHFAGFCRVFLP